MPEEKDWSEFDLGTPAIYRIKIRGYLDDDWSPQLGGMTIQHQTTPKETTITTLKGIMADQAALFGVLSSLYGLGFPILSVKCLPEEIECEQEINHQSKENEK